MTDHRLSECRRLCGVPFLLAPLDASSEAACLTQLAGRTQGESERAMLVLRPLIHWHRQRDSSEYVIAGMLLNEEAMRGAHNIDGF